jgi:hypothetical protein
VVGHYCHWQRATRLCFVVAWLPGCYVITVFR